MTRGTYTAATGMLANQTAQDAIAQNLANASTTGYKSEIPTFQSFPEQLLQNMNNRAASAGGLGHGVEIGTLTTDFAPGGFQKTDNPLDVALTGNGYLAFQTPQGVTYSKDGALTQDAQGTLVQANSTNAVLDENDRPIRIPANTKNITITNNGTVMADKAEVGKLKLVTIDQTTQAQKIGDNRFEVVTAKTAGSDVTVRQGFLETSNVSVVKEMVGMIAAMRAYETNQKMLQSQDELTGKAVNDIAKV